MNFLPSKNPFKDSYSYVAELLELPEPCAVDGASENRSGNNWIPAVDVLEGKTSYLFIADLPGLEKNTVQVIREREVLLIRGERKLENRENRLNPLRLERPEGYFVRQFTLPDNASRQSIKAKLANGVLRIIVRKLTSGRCEMDYPQRLQVNIN